MGVSAPHKPHTPAASPPPTCFSPQEQRRRFRPLTVATVTLTGTGDTPARKRRDVALLRVLLPPPPPPPPLSDFQAAGEGEARLGGAVRLRRLRVRRFPFSSPPAVRGATYSRGSEGEGAMLCVGDTF